MEDYRLQYFEMVGEGGSEYQGQVVIGQTMRKSGSKDYRRMTMLDEDELIEGERFPTRETLEHYRNVFFLMHEHHEQAAQGA